MLCNVAIQAAREAGQWIEKFDHHGLQRIFKDAGSSAASQLVTEADIASEEIIRRRLQEISQPLNIAFVGEESSLSPTPLNSFGTHSTAPYPLPRDDLATLYLLR